MFVRLGGIYWLNKLNCGPSTPQMERSWLVRCGKAPFPSG
jgi:hypothetical protein